MHYYLLQSPARARSQNTHIYATLAALNSAARRSLKTQLNRYLSPSGFWLREYSVRTVNRVTDVNLKIIVVECVTKPKYLGFNYSLCHPLTVLATTEHIKL